jgi:ketosteroid isomerase-like protein
MRGGLGSREVANRFIEALRKLEEDRDVETLVEVHTDDCDVGNFAVPRTFSGHDGLREFWKSYRDTLGEMRSESRNVFADDAGHAALEWNTSGRANGKDVSYDGVSLLEIEDGKVSRFRAYFEPRTVSSQVVD